MSQTGNTTCKTTSLDWFTQSVGETPCRTYERLRQTCNPSYLVGSLSPDPPGNQCDDQLLGSREWGHGDTGFDAAAGSYQIFLGKCGAGTNQSLPTITQKALNCFVFFGPQSESDGQTEERSSSPNIGAIAGGIVGGVGLLVIAALVFWFSRRRQSRRNSLDLGEDNSRT
ncbi:P-loop containing nucleoside triphosphate hydrolase protein [Ceratobasidium sp. AG-Ba]|nr:P-loop containing nucleoside triphosphate hydrolase protein [Ceratobasidium sp. AG-Ba]